MTSAALLGGLLNPLGWFYIVASALPSTLGANAGLLSLPLMMKPSKEDEVGTISRSAAWIVAGAIASILSIAVLGRGLTWTK